MMYLEVRFVCLTFLMVCVFARDIVVDKNDERIQRYLKKYRRTSATVEKDNRPVAIPYRGRFTGGSYSYSTYDQRRRYTVGQDSEIQKQEERIRQERERWQQESQRRAEQERLERERALEEKHRIERERIQQQHESQRRAEQERLEREKVLEEQRRMERERIQQQKESQRRAEQERADRERRHEESQRAIEQQRYERDRRAKMERQRRIEIEKRRREQQQREQQEVERRKQQEEYENAIRRRQEEYERQERERQVHREQEQRRRQQEENRLREEKEKARQEEERRQMEEERRRQQQALEEERRRQQQAERTVAHGQGPTDLHTVRATLRSELEAIIREMRNQYEDSISGRNTLAGISRQLEVLMERLSEQMQNEPTDEIRNVKQQLEYWMRRLEQMAREDTFNCETAKREITSLKDKVDYVERLIVHQGHSRGSQYRRFTTPRPPTVPDHKNPDQLPAVTLQRPAQVDQRWQEQQQQHTGYNQGSRRNNNQVDKWLPATRERHNTRMAASKDREKHMMKRKNESARKAEEMVRGLQQADKKPWKPRRGRRPSKGITGLLDHRVVDRAEVDPLDALWIEEHSAPQTIVVDSPGIKHPDWLIRQGQQRSSSNNRLKQINVYHQSIEQRRGHDDSRLLGDTDVSITDYQVPPGPQSYSRQIHNTSGSCPGYVDNLSEAQTVRRVTDPIIGAWMKDTAYPDPRVWAIEESNALHWDELLEYSNEDDFINQRSPVRHRLPERCSGLGAVVHNGDLYCQLFAHLRKSKPSIVRIRLYGDVLISRAELPGKQIGTKGWAGAYMNVQLSADSSGIWTIFAGVDGLLNIFLLDTNLNRLQGWRTTISKDSVGPAFMICGVMYAFDSHYANNVAYIYDTALSQGRYLTANRVIMPFEDMATVHYNPSDGNLYMWTLEREENRNTGYGKFRFALRARVYGVAERIPVHLSKVRVHM